MNWVAASLLVIVLWGVVGLFQKVGANHSSSDSLFLWTTAGYLLLIPFLLPYSQLLTLDRRSILVGVAAGLTNGIGAWCLYAALEKGASASVAVPLTALNPTITIALAVGFLHERLTAVQIVGVIAALAAGAMLSYEPSPSSELNTDPTEPIIHQ
jgi:drug/metabolite transporter (DMT)-like permease